MAARSASLFVAVVMALLPTACDPETATNTFRRLGWSEAALEEDLKWAMMASRIPPGDVTVWISNDELRTAGPPDPVWGKLPVPDDGGLPATRTFNVFPERQEVVEINGSVASLARCSDLVPAGACEKGCVVADKLNWECWQKTPEGTVARETRRTMSKGMLTVMEVTPNGHPYFTTWRPLPKPTFRQQVVAAWLNLWGWWLVHGPKQPAKAPSRTG